MSVRVFQDEIGIGSEAVDSAKVDAPCRQQPGWASSNPGTEQNEKERRECCPCLPSSLPAAVSGASVFCPGTGSYSIMRPWSLQLVSLGLCSLQPSQGSKLASESAESYIHVRNNSWSAILGLDFSICKWEY